MQKFPDDTARKLGLEGPGPAKYCLPSTVGHNNHDISKNRSPSFSMGVRLPGIFCDQNVKSPSPGPKYQVEYMTKYGRANIPTNSFPNLRRIRPQSCKLGSRNHSLDRRPSPERINSNEISRKASIMNTKLPSMNLNPLDESKRTLRRGDSRHVIVNSGLRTLCNELQGKTSLRRSRISSARGFASVPAKN
ncbi:hypothetical protein HHI36_003580 [Cryptolaemus montrouzieri]|uniref:Uncharacterized protein n=1 Tax=Cryptolaemus montrouzieri TaxID=559131 RepID=A0ABD2PDV3_9CUCU